MYETVSSFQMLPNVGSDHAYIWYRPSSSDEKAHSGDSGDQGQRSGDVEGQQATMWRIGYYDPYGGHCSMDDRTNISTSAPK